MSVSEAVAKDARDKRQRDLRPQLTSCVAAGSYSPSLCLRFITVK